MSLPTLSDVHVDAALTDVSVSYRQENPAISDILFPRVPVTKQSDKYHIWDKADLWRRNAHKRAPGGDFPLIGIRKSTDTYFCDQYVAAFAIPDELRRNQDQGLNVELTGTNTIVDTLNLEKDLTFATDFMKTTVWGTDKTVTTKWSDGTSDPAGDLLTARRVLRRAVGSSRQHRIIGVCGTIVETAFLNHPDVIERIKYTQRATVDEVRGLLAAWLGIDQLIVSDREYTTSAEGADTATYAPVIDDDLLVLAVPTNPGLEIATAGYSFYWDDEGNGDIYVKNVRDVDHDQDVIRGYTHYDQKLVASALGYFFSDCVD